MVYRYIIMSLCGPTFKIGLPRIQVEFHVRPEYSNIEKIVTRKKSPLSVLEPAEDCCWVICKISWKGSKVAIVLS